MKKGIVMHSDNFDERSSHILKNFRKSEDFCDVVIGCTDSNGKSVKAHKVIISAFSSVLRNLVKQSTYLNANNYASILIRGISHQDLESIIDYIYLGEVCIDEERVSKFLLVAEDLQIEGLTNIRISCKDINDEEFKGGTVTLCDSTDIRDKIPIFTKKKGTHTHNSTVDHGHGNLIAKENKQSKEKNVAIHKSFNVIEDTKPAPNGSQVDKEVWEHIEMLEDVCKSSYEQNQVHDHLSESMINGIKQNSLCVQEKDRRNCKIAKSSTNSKENGSYCIEIEQNVRDSKVSGSKNQKTHLSRSHTATADDVVKLELPMSLDCDFEIVEGRRKGAKIYKKDNYGYTCDAMKAGVKYLLCVERSHQDESTSCPSRAKISGNNLIITMEHNHPPSKMYFAVSDLENRIKRRAEESTESFRKIFEEESLLSDSEAVARVSFQSLRSAMKMRRGRNHF